MKGERIKNQNKIIMKSFLDGVISEKEPWFCISTGIVLHLFIFFVHSEGWKVRQKLGRRLKTTLMLVSEAFKIRVRYRKAGFRMLLIKLSTGKYNKNIL